MDSFRLASIAPGDGLVFRERRLTVAQLLILLLLLRREGAKRRKIPRGTEEVEPGRQSRRPSIRKAHTRRAAEKEQRFPAAAAHVEHPRADRYLITFVPCSHTTIHVSGRRKGGANHRQWSSRNQKPDNAAMTLTASFSCTGRAALTMSCSCSAWAALHRGRRSAGSMRRSALTSSHRVAFPGEALRRASRRCDPAALQLTQRQRRFRQLLSRAILLSRPTSPAMTAARGSRWAWT
jgi:hypothetical protein